MAFVYVFVVVLANAVAFVGARALVAKACNVHGIKARLGLEDPPWSEVGFGKRLAFGAVGPVACYFVAALFMALGLMSAGRLVVDEASMRVNVAIGGPADRAGIRDGDKIVLVDGCTVDDWPTLKEVISKHVGGPLTVVVERDGAQRTFTPTPGPGGKILIGPWAETHPVGVGAALRAGLVGPPEVWGGTLRGIKRFLLGASEPVEIAGPVNIVRETRRASNTGDAWRFLGAVNAYLLFFPVLLSIILFPRIRRRA